MQNFERMIVIFSKEVQQQILNETILNELSTTDILLKTTDSNFTNRVFFYKNKSNDTLNFIIDIYQTFLNNIPNIQQSFSTFYTLSQGIWTVDKKQNKQNANFILNILKDIGAKINIASKENNKEAIASYLSASLGVLTILIQYPNNYSSKVLYEICNTKNSDNYFGHYQWVIAQSIGILFELLVKSKYIIEPLFTYLVETNIIQDMLYKHLMEDENEQEAFLYFICMNFSLLPEFNNISVIETYVQTKLNRCHYYSDIPVKTYISIRNFWGEKES